MSHSCQQASPQTRPEEGPQLHPVREGTPAGRPAASRASPDDCGSCTVLLLASPSVARLRVWNLTRLLAPHGHIRARGSVRHYDDQLPAVLVLDRAEQGAQAQPEGTGTRSPETQAQHTCVPGTMVGAWGVYLRAQVWPWKRAPA